MKAFVAALSLLVAGASAEADPQFLVGSPLVHSLAYNTPVVYKTAEKAKDAKVTTYTNQLYPQAYQTPYYYQDPQVVLKKADDPIVPYVHHQPLAYAHHQPLAYAHHQPLVHHTPVVYKTAAPQPKYLAKNGGVEHLVFKRDAEPEPEAESKPFVYYNTHGSLPVGYVAPATYTAGATYPTPAPYANAPLATSYKYVTPYTYGQASFAPQYYGLYHG